MKCNKDGNSKIFLIFFQGISLTGVTISVSEGTADVVDVIYVNIVT